MSTNLDSCNININVTKSLDFFSKNLNNFIESTDFNAWREDTIGYTALYTLGSTAAYSVGIFSPTAIPITILHSFIFLILRKIGDLFFEKISDSKIHGSLDILEALSFSYIGKVMQFTGPLFLAGAVFFASFRLYYLFLEVFEDNNHSLSKSPSSLSSSSNTTSFYSNKDVGGQVESNDISDSSDDEI